MGTTQLALARAIAIAMAMLQNQLIIKRKDYKEFELN